MSNRGAREVYDAYYGSMSVAKTERPVTEEYSAEYLNFLERAVQTDVRDEAKMQIKEILRTAAKAAHEVNRVFCNSLGDFSQVPWEDTPHDHRASVMSGVLAVYHDPEITSERQHELWLDHKLDDGWTWGPVKDPVKKEHPCVDRYHNLPMEQRVKDELFRATVRGVIARYMPAFAVAELVDGAD